MPSGRNLFCAGHVTLPDGRLLVAGGHVDAYEGTKETNLFDPLTKTWTRAADMARARWYPTVTTLPDGRVLALSGDAITLRQHELPTPLVNGSETLPEIYDVGQDRWTPLPAGQRRMPLYPFVFVLPDGRVVDAGPDTRTRVLDPATGLWSDVGESPIDGHSAVMYRPGKILKSGTWADPDFPGRGVTGRAATIDMNQAAPHWSEVAAMHRPRAYHTLTALPDGTVLATGGATASDGIDGSKASLSAEVWDPDTGAWTELASGQVPRLYHSSALLLPDGRVLLAGGGAFSPAVDQRSAEIFSPPYLFRGARPRIVAAPTLLGYRKAFTVQAQASGESPIASASLVRMGSVTHNFDMDQRFVSVRMAAGTEPGTVRVETPANPAVAPPGWYMLFLLDARGVPSEAWILRLAPDGGGDEAVVPGGAEPASPAATSAPAGASSAVAVAPAPAARPASKPAAPKARRRVCWRRVKRAAREGARRWRRVRCPVRRAARRPGRRVVVRVG